MDDNTIAELLLSAIFGLIPATIAYYRNRSFFLWWFFGWLFPIIAIIVVLIMKPLKICPQCSEKVKKAAVVCKHCGNQLPTTAIISPPATSTI